MRDLVLKAVLGLIVLILVLFMLSARADAPVYTNTWDITDNVGTLGHAVEWDQAQTVARQYDITFLSAPYVFPTNNYVIIWDVVAVTNEQISFIATTATVVGANSLLLSLDPEESNLMAGRYVGRVFGLTLDGTNVVTRTPLVRQAITVRFSTDSRFFDFVGPLTYDPLLSQLTGVGGTNGITGGGTLGSVTLQAYQPWFDARYSQVDHSHQILFGSATGSAQRIRFATGGAVTNIAQDGDTVVIQTKDELGEGSDDSGVSAPFVVVFATAVTLSPTNKWHQEYNPTDATTIGLASATTNSAHTILLELYSTHPVTFATNNLAGTTAFTIATNEANILLFHKPRRDTMWRGKQWK